MKKHLVPLLAALALQPAAAFAEDGGPAWSERLKGLYFGLNVGWANPKDNDKADDWSELTFEYDSGPAFRLAVGYAEPNGKLRNELEVGWQKVDADFSHTQTQRTGAPGTVQNESPSVSVLSFMLNMYYDFKNRTGFTPFLGGGMGYAKSTLEYTLPSLPEGYRYSKSDDFPGRAIKEDHWQFSVQVGGGLGYALTEHIGFEVKYLYFWSGELVQSHNVYGGLRYTF